ncbi:hypothetical protein [Falsirhodobacter halotolerans]|nr:hypothetical protein [Falsirhodobacter halotolerans]MCJ8139076.1 hypothetical protein [Falsirhodobacter halotolerans]
MTNRVAIYLAAIIIAAILLDQVMGWGAITFLMRKFLRFLDWIMFWR